MHPPKNHVAMMQIECEVTNTKLLHISEEAIPSHITDSLRNASVQRNRSRSGENHQNHQDYHHDNRTGGEKQRYENGSYFNELPGESNHHHPSMSATGARVNENKRHAHHQYHYERAKTWSKPAGNVKEAKRPLYYKKNKLKQK